MCNHAHPVAAKTSMRDAWQRQRAQQPRHGVQYSTSFCFPAVSSCTLYGMPSDASMAAAAGDASMCTVVRPLLNVRRSCTCEGGSLLSTPRFQIAAAQVQQVMQRSYRAALLRRQASWERGRWATYIHQGQSTTIGFYKVLTCCTAPCARGPVFSTDNTDRIGNSITYMIMPATRQHVHSSASR